MTSSSRPPPLILFIQNTSIEQVSNHLTDAGLRVAQARIDEDILATVLKMGPDLIVIDFSGNAETVERLKGDSRTKSIPLIGLVDAALAREWADGPRPHRSVASLRDRLAPVVKMARQKGRPGPHF